MRRCTGGYIIDIEIYLVWDLYDRRLMVNVGLNYLRLGNVLKS